MKNRLIPQLLLALSLAFGSSLSAQAADAEPLKAGEFSFKFAKPWENVSSGRPMRAGELKYDHTEEGLEDVEVVFYYFGAGQGGGIEANIQRWVGQFEAEPKIERETIEVDGHKIHYLYAKGTYLDSGMGGPFAGQKTSKPNYMMLAAIIESDQGAVFLKAAAPEKSAEAIKDAFKKLSQSPFEK
ncbi:MAG: hypothetical protein KDN20_17805 [Verrucomicrobiae bacterium]|nr:hypothetical protein [Verrucomicrobiae bacterium]